MNITGIICEYNPFHNGHRYHISETRRICGSDYIVGIMSGCYTQRGTPAIADKYTRARMALKAGCDMIIELPVRYATSSAEGFAAAGISLLRQSGIIESVCFGTEQGNLDGMTRIAHIFKDEPAEYRQLLIDEMRKGASYPAARAMALNIYLANSDNSNGIKNSNTPIEYKPNNILAIEYIKACLDNNITPYTIQRSGKGYHSLALSRICSAEALRHLISVTGDVTSIADYVPDDIYKLLKYPVFTDDYSLIMYSSLSSHVNELEQYLDISKSLAARISNKLYEYEGWDSFIQLIKSKQYTYTRVQRALLHCMLGIRKTHSLDDTNSAANCDRYPVPYIRVLGFKKSASCVMKALSENASLPVITKPAKASEVLDEFGIGMFEEDTRAAELYRHVVQNRYHINTKTNEYTHGLIII